jgi:hypothetical protein
VTDVVVQRDLAQGLARCHTLQGLARLMLGQLTGIDIIGFFRFFDLKPPA